MLLKNVFLQIIWKGAYGNRPRRETSAGRGIILQKYYSIRRKLRKCGILKKEPLKHTAEESLTPGYLLLLLFIYYLVYYISSFSCHCYVTLM